MTISIRALGVIAGGLLVSGSAVSAASPPRTYVVIINAMKFGPTPARLNRGDSIMWVNRDFVRHSATAADHSFDVDLPAGAKAITVIKERGSIPFACRYHPGMRGMLRVE